MSPKAKFTPDEIKNSKRIQKSATPKYTLDWYIKWVASAFVLAGMSMRGIDGLQLYDLSVSMIGIISPTKLEATSIALCSEAS